MIEVPSCRTQSIADIPKRLALCKLTEQHGDQVVPTIKAFLVFIRPMEFD
jgi:hypothetical protein